LGFDGLTALIEFEDSGLFARVLKIARRLPSCSEWTEENGRRLLHITFLLGDMDNFRPLAVAAAPLPHKKLFLRGMEIRWPDPSRAGGFLSEIGEEKLPPTAARSSVAVALR